MVSKKLRNLLLSTALAGTLTACGGGGGGGGAIIKEAADVAVNFGRIATTALVDPTGSKVAGKSGT
jgi:hypothetical protein